MLTNQPNLQMAFKDSAITIAATEDTWTEVTNGTTALWTATNSGFTVAGDSVTVITAGDYVANLSLSFYATADDTIHIRLIKNDAAGLVPTARAVCVGAEIINLNIPVLLPDLVAGDDFKVQIMNSNNGDDPIILDGAFVMHMIRYD